MNQKITKPLKKLIKRKFGRFMPFPYVLPDSIPAEKKFSKSIRGGVIFTADFELAWAVRYSKTTKDPMAYARSERANVPIILQCADDYNIPITWATVGHLFLEKCSKGDHDWMARLPYMDDHWRFTEGDWFDHDPYSSLEDDPEWYAPDLIKMILASKIKHEIACHTFSHIDCSDKNCPPQVLDDELVACMREADKMGLELKSIAFPGGTVGNLPVLAKHGIKIYRRRVGKYELGYPYRDSSGLLVSPTGPCIALPHPGWTIEEEFVYFKKSIDKAIKRNTLAHMWFHPASSKEAFTLLMPKIFAYCAQKRAEGLLWIGTMNDLQKHINTNHVL